MTTPDSNTFQFDLYAEGSGLESFFLATLGNSTGAAIALPGFTVQNSLGHSFLESPDLPGTDFLLDNGLWDENPADGAFRLTVDTSGWPGAVYQMVAGAQNRPGPGEYAYDYRHFSVTVGGAGAGFPFVSNAPDAVHRVIYKHEDEYTALPTMYVMPDGRLGIFFTNQPRPTHIGTGGGTTQMASSDGGETWQETSDPMVAARWLNGNGDLALAKAQGWLYAPESQYDALAQQGKVIRLLGDGQLAYMGGALGLTSSDGGHNWTWQYLDVPDYVAGLTNYHDNPIVTNEGVRLLAVYGPRKAPSGPSNDMKEEVFLLRSVNDGLNWDVLPMFPSGLPDSDLGFNETALAQVPNGNILAMMRSDANDYLWQSYSADLGLTWSAPLNTGILGYPGDLLVLPDDQVVLTYGYRSNPMMGVRAVVSGDGGLTWSQEFILRGDGVSLSGDVGYPTTVLLPDGRLFTAYYIVGADGITHIAGTHWRLEPTFPEDFEVYAADTFPSNWSMIDYTQSTSPRVRDSNGTSAGQYLEFSGPYYGDAGSAYQTIGRRLQIPLTDDGQYVQVAVLLPSDSEDAVGAWLLLDGPGGYPGGGAQPMAAIGVESLHGQFNHTGYTVWGEGDFGEAELDTWYYLRAVLRDTDGDSLLDSYDFQVFADAAGTVLLAEKLGILFNNGGVGSIEYIALRILPQSGSPVGVAWFDNLSTSHNPIPEPGVLPLSLIVVMTVTARRHRP